MEELFRKYLDNQCSPADVKVLMAHFNNPENEQVFRRLIAESLENAEVEDDGSQFQEATDRLFVQIEKKISGEKGKVVPFFPRTWIRVAAAVILLLGSFFMFKYFNSNSGTPVGEIAKVDTVTNEIGPGGNRAVVTLADGSTINLEKALNNTLAKQGNSSLVKLADGQLTYKSLNEKPTDNLYNSVATPRGGQYQITLSDGSMVWLNAASSIRFPVAFTGNDRVVELTGEAYFEVAKNKAMPFKVKMANKAEVEVLGTHFNVNAYDDEGSINTTLLEGSVRVTDRVHDHSKIIAPGEQAKLGANDQIEINKQADVEQVIAWKNGIFSFHHADLEVSLRRIARWYDVEILFEGPIPQKTFNGEMQRSLNLSQVIKLLEKAVCIAGLKGRNLL